MKTLELIKDFRETFMEVTITGKILIILFMTVCITLGIIIGVPILLLVFTSIFQGFYEMLIQVFHFSKEVSAWTALIISSLITIKIIK